MQKSEESKNNDFELHLKTMLQFYAVKKGEWLD